jgi:hypothetical protein
MHEVTIGNSNEDISIYNEILKRKKKEPTLLKKSNK